MRQHPAHPDVVFTHRVEFMPAGMNTAWAIINWCNQVVGEETVQWRYDWWPGKRPYRWWFRDRDLAIQFQLTWGGTLSEQ
jgi:hypothetical protein